MTANLVLQNLARGRQLNGQAKRGTICIPERINFTHWQDVLRDDGDPDTGFDGYCMSLYHTYTVCVDEVNHYSPHQSHRKGIRMHMHTRRITVLSQLSSAGQGVGYHKSRENVAGVAHAKGPSRATFCVGCSCWDAHPGVPPSKMGKNVSGRQRPCAWRARRRWIFVCRIWWPGFAPGSVLSETVVGECEGMGSWKMMKQNNQIIKLGMATQPHLSSMADRILLFIVLVLARRRYIKPMRALSSCLHESSVWQVWRILDFDTCCDITDRCTS